MKIFDFLDQIKYQLRGTIATVTPPEVLAFSVNNPNPNTITVMFDEDFTGDETGFTPKIGGTPSAISSFSGSGSSIATIVIADTIIYSDTITLEYDADVGNIVSQATGVILLSFTQAVDNNTLDETLGSEEVTNGSFTTDTAWTKGTGWTIADGVLKAANADGTTASQTTSMALKRYRVTFSCNITSGSFFVRDSYGNITAEITEDKAYSFDLQMFHNVVFDPVNFTGEIDNISIKEIVGGTDLYFEDGEIGTIDTTTMEVSFKDEFGTAVSLAAGNTDGTYTLIASGGAVTLSSPTITGGKLRVTTSRAITYDETLTFSYTNSGANPLQDASANEVLTFGTVPITNNVTVPTLGAEQVTNGDFATDTDWNKGIGFTISGGDLVATAASSTTSQTTSMDLKTYRVVFDCVVTSGEFYIRDSYGHVIGPISVTNNYSQDLLFQYNVVIDADNFTGTIDNISIKEVLNQTPTVYLVSETWEDKALGNGWALDWYESAQNVNDRTIDVVNTRARTGTKSLKISHRTTGYPTDATDSTHNRCEILTKEKLDTWPSSGTRKGYMDWNQEYWLGFSVYLEDGASTLEWWNSIMQNHSVPGNWNWGICDAGYNNWSMSYDDGSWLDNGIGYPSVNIYSRPIVSPDSVDQIPGIGSMVPVLWNQRLSELENTWIDVVLNFVTSDGSDGKMVAWINGVKQIEHYGPNHHTNDSCGVPRERCQSWSIGSYRRNQTSIRVTQYYDNIRLTDETGSYEKVDPSLA